jgi:hypothetical protein
MKRGDAGGWGRDGCLVVLHLVLAVSCGCLVLFFGCLVVVLQLSFFVVVCLDFVLSCLVLFYLV